MRDKFILLVEDNEDDILLTKKAIEKNKIANELVVKKDGEAALDFLLNEENPHPQIILLDINLPKLNGLEVLKIIKKEDKTKFIPTIILTSSRQEKDVIRSYEFGANSYIQKPVDFIQFQKAIKQLELYWLILNLTPEV